MTSFIILLWLTPDDFTGQCGRLGSERVKDFNLLHLDFTLIFLVKTFISLNTFTIPNVNILNWKM